MSMVVRRFGAPDRTAETLRCATVFAVINHECESIIASAEYSLEILVDLELADRRVATRDVASAQS